MDVLMTVQKKPAGKGATGGEVGWEEAVKVSLNRLHPNNLSDSETVDCDDHHNHARWTTAQKSEGASGNSRY